MQSRLHALETRVGRLEQRGDLHNVVKCMEMSPRPSSDVHMTKNASARLQDLDLLKYELKELKFAAKIEAVETGLAELRCRCDAMQDSIGCRQRPSEISSMKVQIEGIQAIELVRDSVAALCLDVDDRHRRVDETLCAIRCEMQALVKNHDASKNTTNTCVDQSRSEVDQRIQAMSNRIDSVFLDLAKAQNQYHCHHGTMQKPTTAIGDTSNSTVAGVRNDIEHRTEVLRRLAALDLRVKGVTSSTSEQAKDILQLREDLRETIQKLEKLQVEGERGVIHEIESMRGELDAQVEAAATSRKLLQITETHIQSQLERAVHEKQLWKEVCESRPCSTQVVQRLSQCVT